MWAFITLFAFYFTARMVSSPVAAALGTLLWLAFHFNMHFARRYVPVNLCYLPPILGLGMLVRYVTGLTERTANLPQRPAWKDASFFKRYAATP